MKTTVYAKGKRTLSNVKRNACALAAGTAVALAGAVPVLASESTSVEDAVISGMTSAASSMTSMVGKAVPVIIPIVTAVVVVTFGLKLFKKLTGKA